MEKSGPVKGICKKEMEIYFETVWINALKIIAGDINDILRITDDSRLAVRRKVC